MIEPLRRNLRKIHRTSSKLQAFAVYTEQQKWRSDVLDRGSLIENVPRALRSNNVQPPSAFRAIASPRFKTRDLRPYSEADIQLQNP